MNIKEKFLKTIKEQKLIKRGDSIIVGVSGGADSICLLTLLNLIKKEWKLKLGAVHINYKTRGADSEKDQKLVEKYCRQQKIKLNIINYKKDKYSKNIEEEFRNFRYQYFETMRKKLKAEIIAVAHNQNDQAETMLMFFLRGSGLRGLSGIKYIQGKIVRPLLDISKEEIYDYLRGNQVRYREDLSNLELKYTRNKIRHVLIPLLAAEYNPNIINTLDLNRGIIADEYEFINHSAKVLFKALTKCSQDQITINLNKFFALYRSLQRELIRLVFIRLKKNIANISVLDIEEMLRVMKEGREGAERVIKGLRFKKKDGSMVVYKVKNL